MILPSKVLCIGPILLAAALGDARALADGAAPTPSRGAEATRLVEQLGDRAFVARQRAERRLLELGEAAESALEAAARHPDAEIRGRAARLRKRLAALQFESRLEAFLRGPQTSGRGELPGWSAYERAVGDSAESRELFVAMQRAAADLLRDQAQGPRQASQALVAWCETTLVYRSAAGAAANHNELVGLVAAELLVAGDDLVAVDEQTLTVLTRTAMAALPGEVHTSGRGPLLRKLLERWMQRAGDSAQASFQKLVLGLSLKLPEAAIAARRLVGAERTHPVYRAEGAAALGRIGTLDDLPRLAPLLAETAVCSPQQRDKGRIETQVRDVALAAMVQLAGEKLVDYGFDSPLSQSPFGFDRAKLGFHDAAQREAALRRWQERHPAPDARR